MVFIPKYFSPILCDPWQQGLALAMAGVEATGTACAGFGDRYVCATSDNGAYLGAVPARKSGHSTPVGTHSRQPLAKPPQRKFSLVACLMRAYYGSTAFFKTELQLTKAAIKGDVDAGGRIVKKLLATHPEDKNRRERLWDHFAKIAQQNPDLFFHILTTEADCTEVVRLAGFAPKGLDALTNIMSKQPQAPTSRWLFKHIYEQKGGLSCLLEMASRNPVLLKQLLSVEDLLWFVKKWGCFVESPNEGDSLAQTAKDFFGKLFGLLGDKRALEEVIRTFPPDSYTQDAMAVALLRLCESKATELERVITTQRDLGIIEQYRFEQALQGNQQALMSLALVRVPAMARRPIERLLINIWRGCPREFRAEVVKVIHQKRMREWQNQIQYGFPNHAEIGLRTSVNPTYHQLYELLRKKPFRGPIKYVLVTSFDGVVELRLINGGTTLGRHFTHAHLLCEGDVVIACGMLDMQVSTGRPTIIIDGESTNFPTTEESVTLSGTDLDHMTKAQPCGLKVARGTLKSLYPQCSI